MVEAHGLARYNPSHKSIRKVAYAAVEYLSLKNRDRPIEQAARDKIAKHRKLYNLLPGDLGFLPLVVSTSGRLNADFIRLVYLHATMETKDCLSAIDPVDAVDRHERGRGWGST